MLKPFLATDYDEDKLVFPLIVEPKIDGVRGLYLNESFTTRTLRPFANKYTQSLFNNPIFKGFDGELTGDVITSPSLCRDTTSMLNKITGEPLVVWNLFDYITEDTVNLGYLKRHAALIKRVEELRGSNPEIIHLLNVVPVTMVYDIHELEMMEARYLDEGYEGVILRDPNGKYKSGRATVNEGAFLRIKRFSTEEALVMGIVEANENTNEKVVNRLGRSERSSHKANMVPKGMVGMLLCRDLKTGNMIEVGPGKMTHKDRIHYFNNKDELIGKYISYKFFSKGVKDKPRFPTFEYIRPENDIVVD
jgi:DNA ligase-1